MEILSIAIDGPAAAGKSTVAKKIADILHFTYIDTGAMYRAITYFVLQNGINPEYENQVVEALSQMKVELLPGGVVLLNGVDVSKEIRTSEIARHVSLISSYKPVRLQLVALQRNMASYQSVVMDGRDIGTYVLPGADVKIFQVASVETRAKRRYEENIAKGMDCSLEGIEEELRRRDFIDSTRTFAPLKPADDSIILDTSDLTIDEAVSAVLSIVKKKLGECKNE